MEELPINKPLINGKYRTKDAIKKALYNLLDKENVEGIYSDENWSGVKKLQTILSNNDVPFQTIDADYEGHGEAQDSSLPTKKVYRISLTPRDKEGKSVQLYLKVTSAFVGKTGTMADSQYELTYYFF